MVVALREIQESDAENLVQWRNENAEWFPAGEPLTVESHLAWYRNRYLTDPSQSMYMTLLDGRPVGVVGMTIHRGAGELERMILGNKAISRSGIMRESVRMLMDAYGLAYYWLRVMPHNEVTINFHKRNGFKITATVPGGDYTDIHGNHGEYVVMDRSHGPWPLVARG